MIILLRILHVDSVFTECLPKDYMLHAQRTIKTCWAPKNWCLWTAVLDKTLESPLDGKETKPVNPKGNQSWIFIGRTDAEAKAPILWPPEANSWLFGKDPDAGKDWRQEEQGMTEKWDGWMASPIQWTWVWANSGKWWRTGKPGVLQSMGSQRARHDWITEQLKENFLRFRSFKRLKSFWGIGVIIVII